MLPESPEEQIGDTGPEQMPEQQEEVQATPEEEKTYQAYVKEALKPIASNGNVWQGMLKTMRSGKSFLPHTIAMIAVRLYTQAEKALGPLDDDDIAEAVAEAIIEQLLVAGESANILSKKELSEDLAVESYLRFAKLWSDQNPDRLSDEDKAIAESFKQSDKSQPPQGQPQAPQQNILGGGA